MHNCMKKVFIVICLLLLIVVSPSRSRSGEQLQWHTFNAGMDEAKKQNKPLLVDFYADWCHWCRVMDREVFGDTELVTLLNKHFVAVRIRTDAPGEKILFNKRTYTPQEFAQVAGVQGLPTVLFLSEKEEPLLVIPGYVQKNVFQLILNYIKNRCYANNVNINDYVAGKVKCGEETRAK